MTTMTARWSIGKARPETDEELNMLRPGSRLLALTILCHVVAASHTLAGDTPKPVRIASGVSGHIHPAACISKKGTIVVIFGQSDMKDLRVTRSTDRGDTWTKPAPFEPSAKQSIYPGSLTTLSDGRIVHAWNVWYSDDKKKSRYVQFSISTDEGTTWSEPKSLPKNPAAESIIRHPIVELGPTAWLLPLADQTVVYDPDTEKLTRFSDGRKHGLVPIVRTPKGTFVSGIGLRSTDGARTWDKIAPFPKIAAQGWRHEMIALSNGWLLASDIDGEGVGGGTRLAFVVSKDDGRTWDLKDAFEYYNPGRPIGGRACPRTIELDAKTLGTVFYDVDPKQPGGPGVFFLRTPLAQFTTADAGAKKPPLVKVDSSKLVPLNELGDNEYKDGFKGGFYPGGKNERPRAHEDAGLKLARQVEPRNAEGKADPQGKIVLLSIGMSNTSQASQGFQKALVSAKDVNPRLVFVNGAVGGMTASRIQDPRKPDGVKYWAEVDQRLEKAGVSRAQVQAIWIKEADGGPKEGFPGYARKLEGELSNIVQHLPARFPNARLVYLSSRTYGGYATSPLNPEPYAYESAFAVKWLIERQIKGDVGLTFDASKGEARAPWLSWGPYLWANGAKKRADGFSYEPADFTANDGTHLTPSGMGKVGRLMLQFFQTDTTTRPWFVLEKK
jgi:hypothetical protein